MRKSGRPIRKADTDSGLVPSDSNQDGIRLVSPPLAVTQEAKGAAPRHLWIVAALTVLIIPFENEFDIWGVSPAKVAIVFLLVTVLAARPRQWFSILRHRVYIWVGLFVVWCALCEGFHPYADFEFIYRVLQMFVFSSLIATIALDAKAIRRILLAIASTCVFLAIYLVANYYGAVSLGVSGSREAGRLRSVALQGITLDTGLNILAYTVGIGAVIALSYLLGVHSRRARLFWGAVYVICAIGSFVPLSRGAFVALVCGSLLVLLRNFAQLIRLQVVVLVVGITIAVSTLMPQALTERYSSLLPGEPTTTKREKPDGRLTMLIVALTPISDYWAVGVGAGQYWASWAANNSLGRWRADGRPAPLGPHNAFLAAWIYFGLPGLLFLCFICISAARACFKTWNASPESTALLGLLGLVIVWLMFTHSLYLKLFGVVIGLIVGASQHRRQRVTHRKPIPFRRRFATIRPTYLAKVRYEGKRRIRRYSA